MPDAKARQMWMQDLRSLNFEPLRAVFPDLANMGGYAKHYAHLDPESSLVPIEKQLANEARNRCDWATQHRGAFIPRGMQLTFRCAANFPDGDRLHNRFVLTDFAGASLPYGTQALGTKVFDDISPLYQGQDEVRWRQFTRPDRLQVIGAPRVVEGTAQEEIMKSHKKYYFFGTVPALSH